MLALTSSIGESFVRAAFSVGSLAQEHHSMLVKDVFVHPLIRAVAGYKECQSIIRMWFDTLIELIQ